MDTDPLRASTAKAARLERDVTGSMRRSASAGASAASAAARIAATGADRPGPALDLERGLVHEHAEPVDDRGAAGAGAREQRRFERVVHEIDDDLARRAARRAATGQLGRRRSCPCRSGVALTTIVARGRGVGALVPRRATSARELGRDRRRPSGCGRTTDDLRRPRAPSASATAARRAARAEHQHRRAGRIVPGVAQRPQEPFAVGRVADEPAVGVERAPC